MLLFEVLGLRQIGAREYEISALLEAASHRGAAVFFFRDMASVGWVPEQIVVTEYNKTECAVYRVEANMISPIDEVSTCANL